MRRARLAESCLARDAACHADPAATDDAPRMGPSLKAVMGRKAGTALKFQRYSPALNRSGIVWSKLELDAFLTSPRARTWHEHDFCWDGKGG